MRTVTNVTIAKDDPSDTCYRVQVNDDRVDPFIIEEFNVVRIIDELVEDCSWSAEVVMVPGLVPYLKANDIFCLDVTPSGFVVNTEKLRGEDS